MSAFHIVEHWLPCQHIREYARAQANGQEDVLHLAVKQYIPKDNLNPSRGDVTIIGAHAIAFPKELYEPLWDDLLSRAKTQNWRIRGIWIADVSNHGASAVLNESLLGNDPSWLDHSRDLLHLINLKRDEMPRPLIGIGHSMGGAQLVNLSYIHARLFMSLILIDPVIQERSAEVDPLNLDHQNMARLSTYRRTTWPSREEAAKNFRQSPFFRNWDSRVLDRWIQHCLRDGPTILQPDAKRPAVTLTTPPPHEVHTFLRPNYEGYGVDGRPVNRRSHADLDPDSMIRYPFYRPEPITLFRRLPELRPSALYIFGELSEVSGIGFQQKLDRTGVGVGGSGGMREGRVQGLILEGVGHLIPMEAVQRTADAVSQWVSSEVERFRVEEEEFEREWKKLSLQEKQDIDLDWKMKIGAMPKKAKKESKL